MPRDMTARGITALELFNMLQEQKKWPSGGAPAVFDLRPADQKRRVIRGSFCAWLDANGQVEVAGATSREWTGRNVCLYDADNERLDDHPVARRLLADGDCRAPHYLAEPLAIFDTAYPFLMAKSESSKASKRPLFPSCILSGLLYLGDLTDAAALPRLREQLKIERVVTALAELPPSLKASIAESGAKHTWCNVRDIEEADIKEHFETAYEQIEDARKAGTAILVHCSRGVSRSASLCIAYLMRKEGWDAARARAHVEAARPIILPNEGFWRCMQEYEKEMLGGRSGVYVPLPKPKPLDAPEFEMPPAWAAEPTHTKARLVVEKGGEELESLDIGEHPLYTFGRALTCDVQLDHPSISRQHACVVHHENGGLYVIDLKSSHATFINGKPLRPFEATLLREGASITFGASSRSYRLVGTAPPPAPAGSSGGGSSGTKQVAAAGPQLPGGEKRKYTPADAKAKKRQKWLSGPKSSRRMTENERVAMGAGAGSGCFGPGFD